MTHIDTTREIPKRCDADQCDICDHLAALEAYYLEPPC